jgi:hypothetical protein
MPPGALRDVPAVVDDDFDPDGSTAETAITIVAATVTIAFVSFVAVLMALA